MTNELAKQLKDAGFPLSMRGFDDYCRQAYIPDDESLIQQEKNYAYCPTLEELIEACGDKFFGLNRMGKDQWTTEFMEDENADGDPLYSTPEEAVANLWLSLNKKD